MACLSEKVNGSEHIGPLNYNVRTSLTTLGDSLNKIEQSEGYDRKGVLNERVQFELEYANTIAKYLENIFNTAGMEIPEEYTKKYEFLKGRLIFFNCFYNPLLTASK